MTIGDSPQLGRLEQVPLREVWQHEAHDFTPWLLANPEVLGDALGMDLQLEAAEHPVGGFSLDLIGRDSSTGELVIVENQLDQSDHVHLGQLLTYAGGTNAVNIVWIARRFRDEHRAALDWLNARTDEDTRFFGIELSAVKIGDSPAAPLLKLAAAPNDWNKLVRTAAGGTGTERADLYQSFWANYLEMVHEIHPDWTRASRPPRANWLSLSAGMAGVEYVCTFSKRGLASEIYLGSPDAEVNTARLEGLMGRREAFEDITGPGLEFQNMDGKIGCRVVLYKADSFVTDTASWPSYVDWFIEMQSRLRKAFSQLG